MIDSILCRLESLVEVKKQKLLLMLHPTEEGEGPSEEVGVATDGPPPADGGEGESVDDVVGMKCRAPLKEVSYGERVL